ncbi:MAG: glycosyltransferase family 2 protein [Bacteroidales bacterium]
MKPVISVIIPFLNEAGNIPTLVNSLTEYFKDKDSYLAEIIFVDDGSTDNSLDLLKRQKFSLKGKIISLSKNYGSHAALRAGILNAEGDYIVFMYADLQDPLNLIDQMYLKAINGYEIIWATRDNTYQGVFEKWFTKKYAFLMKKYAISTFPENGFDIVFFSKRIARILNEHIEANSSIFIQILSLGYKQHSISYDKLARKAGKSKWTLSKKIKLFIDSFVAFSYAPIKLVTIIGILFFIFGILWTFYIILREVIIGDLDIGWPTLLSVLLIGFGITNISLGIIAEYLWRTLDTSRKRPVFVIESIVDFIDIS